jgi:hypothetical protein
MSEEQPRKGGGWLLASLAFSGICGLISMSLLQQSAQRAQQASQGYYRATQQQQQWRQQQELQRQQQERLRRPGSPW